MRGAGWRLEALYERDDGTWFAEASVWDAASQRDQPLFDREFWPILNSIEFGSRP
jgi:hypothetical protein